jgi:hypothetical protein
MIDLATYYSTEFSSELGAVCTLASGSGLGAGSPENPRLSIVQFIPPTVDASDHFNSLYALGPVKDPLEFTLASFWDVLVDQATDAAGCRPMRNPRTGRSGLKLRGILGSAHDNLHPALLLLVASMYLRRERSADVASALVDLVKAESDRFSDALSDDGLEIAEAAASGLALLFLPQSLGAYLPNGDRNPRQPIVDSALDWAVVVQCELTRLVEDAPSYAEFKHRRRQDAAESREFRAREAERERQAAEVRRVRKQQQATERLGPAVRRGDLAAVQALLAKGADTTRALPNGASLVAWAEENGQAAIVDFLRSRGIL